MILKKTSNNDLEVLATKNGPWAFYKTKTAANNDLANIPEGSIVAIEEASSTTIDSLPVGTWASFENTDAAPNSQWIKAGTTFDEDDYPELYLYLGTNIVPSRFDHSRLGVYQSITLPTTSGTAITMQYDGILIYVPNGAGTNNVYINDVRICYDRGASGDDSSVTIPFRKNDAIYATLPGGSTSKVAYYTKPLFIKAKSFVEESVPNAAIETVKDYTKSYVDTKNSYSTEETLTGGTWIDGKPIYRKVTSYNGAIESPTLSSSIIINAIVGQPNIDTLISVSYVGRRTNSTGEKMSATFDTWIQSNTTIKVLATSKMYVENIISLYTKTTD